MRFAFALATMAVYQQQAHGWFNQQMGSTPRTSTTTLEMTFSVRKTARRVVDSITNKERSREDLKIGIAGFYDRSSQLWEDVWGEHMHHGRYSTREWELDLDVDMANKSLLMRRFQQVTTFPRTVRITSKPRLT